MLFCYAMDILVGGKGLMRYRIYRVDGYTVVSETRDKQVALQLAASMAEKDGHEYGVWEMIASYSPGATAPVDPGDTAYEAKMEE